ncbi:MAG: hypothetical protein M3Z24_02440, partial [Chloroflexota bacterium]|nr:hypothetical protein [Chloroflexota bacterium]
HRDVFADFIRIATHSKWSHSALIYLLADPYRGYNNTYLVEARTNGVQLKSLRNEAEPLKQFTVGIKRPRLDWYIETPCEKAHHDPNNLEDVHGIGYLRHVRGIGIDQINGLYDKKTVYEISALYAERVSKRHLSKVPQVADAADAVADFFKNWDAKEASRQGDQRFICSGLIQYSFFQALRIRIINDLAIPECREAGMSNLRNLSRIIYREDPEGVIPRYISQVQSGEIDLAGPVPDDVMDLIKTGLPSDFNNSPDLEWKYIILDGGVWQIEGVEGDYEPESEEEKAVLSMMKAEHR